MIRRILKGVFTGGVIGFVLGMLFAPAKGEETRAKLQEAANDPKVKDFVEKAKAKGSELAKKAQDLYNEKLNSRKD
jgi:gas vesicle protein